MKLNKKCLTLIVCLISIMILLRSPLSAKIETRIDFLSRYIWRGFDLNPDNKPVIQPSVTFGFEESGFSVNFWGSFSFEDRELNELDMTFAYDFNMSEDLALSIGFVHYGWYFARNFDFKDNTTQELYLSAILQRVALHPSMSVYYDFGNGDGIYLQFGISHSLKVNKTSILELGAALGYNGGQWIEDTGFSDIGILASLPLKVGNTSISPVLGLSFILLDEVNRNTDYEIWFGVSVIF